MKGRFSRHLRENKVVVPKGHIYLRCVDDKDIMAVSDGTAIRPESGMEQLFDLTLLFGEGHEPETPEEFREHFPKDFFEEHIRRETYLRKPHTMTKKVFDSLADETLKTVKFRCPSCGETMRYDQFSRKHTCPHCGKIWSCDIKGGRTIWQEWVCWESPMDFNTPIKEDEIIYFSNIKPEDDETKIQD